MGGLVARANRLVADGGTVGPNPSPYGAAFAWLFVTPEDEIVLSGTGMIVPTSEGLPRYQHRPWRVTYVLPEYAQVGYSNNLAEYGAVLDALRFIPDGWSGQIVSDSDVTLGRLFRGWNWKQTKASAGIPADWVAEATRHLSRLGKVEPLLVAGHPTPQELSTGTKRGLPTSKFNVAVDRECGYIIREFNALRGIDR